MKIAHCCLAAFYIDHFGYQENILPKMHLFQGHEVTIIASTESYGESLQYDYKEPSVYINENNIRVARLPYVEWLPIQLSKKIRLYNGLYNELLRFKPDIIFIHDCQFLSIYTIAKYAKKNNVTIYVDSHTDFINSGRTFISKNIFHRFIYRMCAQKIEPFTKLFYGTLPLRMKFYNEIYKIPLSKLRLLPFGVDDTVIKDYDKLSARRGIIQKYHIPEGSKIIVSGGKIDQRKNIHLLINAFRKSHLSNTVIVIFGKPTDEMKSIIEDYYESGNIIFTNWLNYEQTCELLIAADIGIFPGTHSVLWEQALGCGLPCIFKYWEGIDHLNINNNCHYLKEISESTLIETMHLYINCDERLEEFKNKAERSARNFSYSEIARNAISRL